MIVFCENPSCYQLPSSCLPLNTKKDFDTQNKCYYQILDKSIVEEWRHYLYMTSIAFMLTNEYHKGTIDYQWILRVDQDAVFDVAVVVR